MGGVIVSANRTGGRGHEPPKNSRPVRNGKKGKGSLSITGTNDTLNRTGSLSRKHKHTHSTRPELERNAFRTDFGAAFRAGRMQSSQFSTDSAIHYLAELYNRDDFSDKARTTPYMYTHTPSRGRENRIPLLSAVIRCPFLIGQPVSVLETTKKNTHMRGTSSSISCVPTFSRTLR